MAGKIILGINALALTAFGLFSLWSPDIPTSMIGLEMTNGDAFAEVGAVYGGLQVALGAFFLIAVVYQHYYRAGLLLLLVVMAGLAIARGFAAVMTADAISSYTFTALGYETVMALLAALLYRLNNK